VSGEFFEVDPQRLYATGRAATDIGESLLDTVKQQIIQLADPGPHGAWAVGQALGRCADAWEVELTDASRAAYVAGTSLAESAAAYVSHDTAAAHAFHQLMPGGNGGTTHD
jgi:hypothetical protein